jgi:hypothetical protein
LILVVDTVESLHISLVAQGGRELTHEAIDGIVVDIGKLAKLAREHVCLQNLSWCVLRDSWTTVS